MIDHDELHGRSSPAGDAPAPLAGFNDARRSLSGTRLTPIQSFAPAALHLRSGEVFLPGEQDPDVPKRIANACRARAVEHVGRRLDRFGARVGRPSEQALVVVGEDMKTGRAAAEG